MSDQPTQTALLAKFGLLDDDGEPCNNDLPPTESSPRDFRDWWTGQEPQWVDCLDLIADDPLLGVLLGAPHEIIMPNGCGGALS
jgi:hypothetical protein